MKGRIPLTPLTTSERQFAAEHFNIIYKYLSFKRLDADDWFDVVCMGFLQAVKKWFVRKDLHCYSFECIAFQSMRSSVSNERRKLERQLKTISLDQAIEGTDGFTLMDTITIDNLNLIYIGGIEHEYQL